jgi:hypothetical protein
VRGRFAEVFIGVSEGWIAEGPEPPTAEEIVDHLELMEGKDRFDLPVSTGHEIDLVSARLDAR